MYRISLSDFKLDGKHGVTEKEKKRAQRFIFALDLDVMGNISEDNIDYVYDYRKAKQTIANVFNEKSWQLIESMAETMLKAIIKDPRVIKARIRISKPDVWYDCRPTVDLKLERPVYDDFFCVDFDEVFYRLKKYGGVSIKLLQNSRRDYLARLSNNFEYKNMEEKIYSSQVEQYISSASDFPEDSSFVGLKNDLSDFLHVCFNSFQIQVFNTPLNLHEFVLQRYKGGDIGITPHRDGKSRINLIAILILSGTAKFGLCEDRQGNNPRYLDATPGNLILLRAPGFLGSDFQPFHFVSDVSPNRTIFSLRQRLQR